MIRTDIEGPEISRSELADLARKLKQVVPSRRWAWIGDTPKVRIVAVRSERACVMCNTRYKAVSGNQKCCSKQCSHKRFLEKQASWKERTRKR